MLGDVLGIWGCLWDEAGNSEGHNFPWGVSSSLHEAKSGIRAAIEEMDQDGDDRLHETNAYLKSTFRALTKAQERSGKEVEIGNLNQKPKANKVTNALKKGFSKMCVTELSLPVDQSWSTLPFMKQCFLEQN